MDARVVREIVTVGKLGFLAFLLVVAGCRQQNAKQVVGARLRVGLPEKASRVDVERYLQREHVEVWKHAQNTLSARFHDVKSDIFCRVDVNVEFVFDQKGLLIKNNSQEMRTCL